MPRILVVLVSSLCISIAGCMATSGMEFIKGDLYMTGVYANRKARLCKKASYCRFRLRVDPSYHKQYEACRSVILPEIYVETGRGTFYLPDVTAGYIQSNWKKLSPDFMSGCSEFYPQPVDTIFDGSRAIICHNNLVVLGGPNDILALWDKEKQHRYPCDLSYCDLVNLFGEPDSIQEWYGK